MTRLPSVGRNGALYYSVATVSRLLGMSRQEVMSRVEEGTLPEPTEFRSNGNEGLSALMWDHRQIDAILDARMSDDEARAVILSALTPYRRWTSMGPVAYKVRTASALALSRRLSRLSPSEVAPWVQALLDEMVEEGTLRVLTHRVYGTAHYRLAAGPTAYARDRLSEEVDDGREG